MVDDNDLIRLRGQRIPTPDPAARARALAAASAAFETEKIARPPQASADRPRLTERARKLWRDIMDRKMIAAPALGALVALPIAGYATLELMRTSPDLLGVSIPAPTPNNQALIDTPADELAKAPSTPAETDTLADTRRKAEPAKSKGDAAGAGAARSVQQAPATILSEPTRNDSDALDGKLESEAPADLAAPAPSTPAQTEDQFAVAGGAKANKGYLVAPGVMSEAMPAPADNLPRQEQSRDRVESFANNPLKSAQQEPVSTFSIDADTASYSFVRRSLKEGVLPQPDTVRVEEMVNYFPYDWKGPESRETPFNTTVSVMPTPWNANTKLMHVAIKGYDVQPTQQPKVNLVFLIDVSGSMDEPDKLPLLRSAFRLLVQKLKPDDTVSIVTYAGDAGTVLEPTKASERDKILRAIDTLTPGGSTAGEAGIREAYRLAQQSFVDGGVNRVMLATDGDFNVGQTDDGDLKRLIEDKRKTGVFLSVFGFGQGNLNDQMMQTLAQNGNGTAAYIDTLAEAEKVLVQDASSTLFPIAKDVKIQIEFNPAKVAEYRLIGYETRALAREDFNNDKVDAGEIGSGHAVTAVYEVTPKGSPAQQVDDLRYGEARTDNPGGIANSDEYAFVKIRYKLPDGDISKLITQPVTAANEVSSFDAAGVDQRFSVAVAAFGQKLRGENATADFGYDRIADIAAAARGADPFGYRAEFLSLVRLASGLSGGAN